MSTSESAGLVTPGASVLEGVCAYVSTIKDERTNRLTAASVPILSHIVAKFITLPHPIKSSVSTLVASGYGFSTILPNIWLFSMYSWALRISCSGKMRSMTGLRRPAKTWPRTSLSSLIVPM